MKRLWTLLQRLNPLACHHARYTFPTKRGAGHTVACLDCGKTLEYDWEHMHLGKALEEEGCAGPTNEPAQAKAARAAVAT